MMTNFSFKELSQQKPELLNRSIIEISGADRKKFLQGLITNDINKVSSDNLIYSAMLNAQGRFLYDLFIHENNEILFLDVAASRRDEIFKKLNFYKLRSQVELKKNDELQVFSNFLGQGFKDPRHQNIGFRAYKKSTEMEFSPTNFIYDLMRIQNKIAEGESDLTSEKSFILEFVFDQLNAVSFEKGCYIGQELTARTHFKGEIRKKLFHVKIPTISKVEKNHEITCHGKSCGQILSSVLWHNELHALAIIKASDQGEYDSLIQDLELLENQVLQAEKISSSNKILVVS